MSEQEQSGGQAALFPVEQPIARHGARYIIGVNYLDEIQEFLSAGCPLAEKYRPLVGAIASLCAADPEGKTDAQAIALASDLSVPTVRVYTEQLVDVGLFTKQLLRPKRRGRPTVLYSMVSLDTFVQSFAANGGGEGIDVDPGVFPELVPDNIERDAHRDRSMFLMPSHPSVYRAEIFSTYTLLSVLRLGKSGRRTRGTYVSDVHVGPARMQIRVAAQEGYAVAGIIDTKALIGLTTYALDWYARPDNEGKPMVIDLADFTRYLEFEPSGGNKRQVWKMVRAWEKTGFTVTYVDPMIRRLYGPNAFTLDEFRLITRIKSLVNGITPERFAVTLEKGFLDRIMDQDVKFLSAVHPQIMREKSAARLLLYYWCRRAIKYKTAPHRWNIFQLHQEMAPYMELGEFRETLKSALPTEGASQYGYVIRPIFENGRLEACEFSADPKDRLMKLYLQRHPELKIAE